MKLLRNVLLVVLAILVFSEIALRINGTKPGVLLDKFSPVDSIIEQHRFKSDSLGVISYDTSCHCLPSGYTLNNQGYRSEVNFDHQSMDSLRLKKKIVMALGDSYTEGCCAQPVDSSFIDRINGQSSEYYILNFGIGSSNPFHYKNILKKHIELIRPDLVLVNIYLGNDVLPIEIKSPPNTPQTYVIPNFTWISSTVPHFYQSEYGKSNFDSHREAYNFYIERFTLFSPKANRIERQYLSKSVVFSRLYLSAKNGYHVVKWMLNEGSFSTDFSITRQLLFDMKTLCDAHDIRIHFSLIPSPKQVKDQVNFENEFSGLVEGLDYSYPEISEFAMKDYDGEKVSAHFNNSGHEKFAKYLEKELNRLLRQ